MGEGAEVCCLVLGMKGDEMGLLLAGGNKRLWFVKY